MSERASRWATAWTAGVLCVVAAAQPGSVTPGQSDPVRAQCSVVGEALLACDFRLTDPADVHAVQASVDGIRLSVQSWYPYPTSRSATAVLLLVDTSAYSRPEAMGPWIEDALRVVELARPHVRLGLAVFDADLRVVVPVGTDRAAVRDALRRLTPTDRPTELYRSALEAVRALAATTADRRALFIFSDGTAEDRAYFHQDVVGAASAAGVMIAGFGYPRSAAHAVALQSLRRLSEETGGVLVAAEPGAAEAPRDSLPAPFAPLESGGTARVDLTPAIAGGHVGLGRLMLNVQTSRGAISTLVAVDLPGPLAPANPRATVSDSNLPAPSPAALAKRESPGVWAWGLGVAVLVALGAAVLTWQRRRRGGRSLPAGDGTIFGYLVFRDQTDRARYALTQPKVRIGRQRDNELVLDDTSVSRHHAEIRRGRDGKLTLVDLDSLNGVFVNERQVKNAVLAEGDAVEIGDVRLLFTRTAEGPPAATPRGGPTDRTIVSPAEAPFRQAARD